MTLDQLAIKHGTDKSSLHHNYCDIYEQYFKHWQHELISFVTVGVGGYEYPDRGGECLRMWRDWFTKADIFGIDLYMKTFKIPGVAIIPLTDQTDSSLVDISRGASIFIDDASHKNPLTLRTFEIVWPVITPGGIYVIEDIESSYCPADGWAQGCSDPMNHEAPTAVNIGKRLVNDINAQYIPHYVAQYADVDSVHFHKNLLVIKKKK